MKSDIIKALFKDIPVIDLPMNTSSTLHDVSGTMKINGKNPDFSKWDKIKASDFKLIDLSIK